MVSINSQLLFSDYFSLPSTLLESYGALNICVEADLPLFIDPFLLFSSPKKEYQDLHQKMINHLVVLKRLATDGEASNLGLFQFPEVKQNWLGWSKWGNNGRGLGPKFARDLVAAFRGFYKDFGEETLTESAHIEKLTLVGSGIGRDFISDFTTNLMLEYLLKYTQAFATKHLRGDQVRRCAVRCVFDKNLLVWKPRQFVLPYFYKEGVQGDFIILTPVDVLTKDEAYISHGDLVHTFRTITGALENRNLRDSINLFFARNLPQKPRRPDFGRAIQLTIEKYPEILDYYIRSKERSKGEAAKLSRAKVDQIRDELLVPIRMLLERVFGGTAFYNIPPTSYESALRRANFLKEVIEDNDGYRIFSKNGRPIATEETIQRIFRLTWFASPFDVNAEVNNGRGPADYKVSFGQRDSTIVEFKLGRSTSLKRNLLEQTAIYKKASKSISDIKVILCYSRSEMAAVDRILKSINQIGAENIVVIDASPKISASKAGT